MFYLRRDLNKLVIKYQLYYSGVKKNPCNRTNKMHLYEPYSQLSLQMRKIVFQNFYRYGPLIPFLLDKFHVKDLLVAHHLFCPSYNKCFSN